MTTIKFYRVKDPYGEFSNFFPAPILIASMVWPTVEHYFQASKFDDYRVQDRILEMKSPMDAAREGRNKANKPNENWETVKDNVMYKALSAKFLQHPELKQVLLNTGNDLIIEHTSNDYYWADGGDGTGKNMLGILLMRVREHIRQISDIPDLVLPPWLSFPHTEKYDMFWRMGLGEDYLLKWSKYIDVYGTEAYKHDFPEPDDWQGTY